MKVTIDTNRVSGLYDKLIKTETGKLAALLDEIIYNAHDGKNESGHARLNLAPTTYDRHSSTKTESVSTEDVLRRARDLLYQKALEKVVK